MIEVVNVTKKFGDFTAIQDLNFKVSDGSIYGLIGYNGAGKTTLLKTITGVYKPDGGEVRLDGENAFDNAKMKQHMFYVPDDIYFAPYANMERQAEIVLGISTKPDFILFDETFDGLDPAKRALIKNLLNEYMEDTNASVIVSSHDLHELEGLCDHFGLINGKKLVLDSSIKELSEGRAKIF